MKIATEDLKKILDDHANWRICKEGGIRANLTGAYLTGAKLTLANLTGADLTDADLARADLTGADLTDADLTDADLARADLTGADLTDADLTDADLTGAKLTLAKLTGTCLDPKNKPSGPQGDWSRDGEFVIAYRTRKSMFICKTTEYMDGQEYVAPYFSIDQTECHPGLYISRTLDDLQRLVEKNGWENYGGVIRGRGLPGENPHPRGKGQVLPNSPPNRG